MRAGVVAHGRAADFVVDHGVDFVADVDGLLGDDAMRAHALHGIGRAFDLGDEGVVIVGVEPADIADLSAGVGVEGRVIKDDLAALAGLELLRADARAVLGLDDRENFRAGGERLAIALEDGRRERLISGAGGFLRAALPRSASARLLFKESGLITVAVEFDAVVSTKILDEIARKPKGDVELERDAPSNVPCISGCSVRNR